MVFYSEVLKFLFKNYPLQKVEANVIEYNKVSVKMHERLGFKVEGIKRMAWFCEGVECGRQAKVKTACFCREKPVESFGADFVIATYDRFWQALGLNGPT